MNFLWKRYKQSVPVVQTTKKIDLSIFQKYYDSPILSDIKINFNEVTISAHRIVLASQSGWFARALEGGFREAAIDCIELHEDDPDAVLHMLQYMYGLVPWDNFKDDSKVSSDELLHLVQIYVVADKYDVPSLSNAVGIDFKKVAADSWIDLWLGETLKPIIEAVYSTNPSPSSSLRMTASELTCTYIESFNDEDTVSRFRILLEGIPDFGADITLRLASEQQSLRRTASSVYDSTEIPHKTFLHWAAQAGDEAAVRQLLGQGIPVDVFDENGETPLHFATWHGRLNATKTLVEAGADVNASSRAFVSTPLQWAVSQGHHAIATYLRSQGAVMPVATTTTTTTNPAPIPAPTQGLGWTQLGLAIPPPPPPPPPVATGAAPPNP